MFHKSIQKLQATRKFIDYKKVELADYPLLSQKLEDCSIQLTMCIADLIKSDRIIKTIPQEEIEKVVKYECDKQQTTQSKN